MSECVKPDFRFCGKSVSLSKLPLPVDGVDVNPQGVLPEDVGVARNLDHDGDDRRPSLGCAELSVLIVTLCPCDTEAVGGGADHAGDLARNLLTPNLGKRVVRAGVVRSEEHTSELQSLMRISYAVFCLKKKTDPQHTNH